MHGRWTIATLWRTARWPRPRAGFTLVELIVVIAICLLIAAIVLTVLWKLYKFIKAMAGQPMSSV